MQRTGQHYCHENKCKARYTHCSPTNNSSLITIQPFQPYCLVFLVKRTCFNLR